MSDDDIRTDYDGVGEAGRADRKADGEAESRPADNVVDFNRWRDFNDAAPQDPNRAAPMREDFEIESVQGIKERLLRNLRGALTYLLPNGVIKGNRFVVGDVQGGKGDSLTVELAGSKAGLWHDFATGEGGDIISLWAAVTGRVSNDAFPDQTV